MSDKRKNRLHGDQSGLVSFMVVMIIMLVLTLIVLSFARLVRREQVQTLDRQLNAQAFYAAESGVNDALNAMSSDSSLTAGTYNDCDDFINAAGLVNDLGSGVSYSCLLVDTTPEELVVDNVSTTESTVLPIRPQGSDPLTELEFTITDSNDGNSLTGCPANGNYPGGWPGGCDIGMLRLELVDFGSNPNRNSLLRNRAVAYIQPSSSGGSPSFTWAQSSDTGAFNTGHRHSAVCTTGGASGVAECRVDLTGLNIRNGYLRLRSIYRSVSVTIRGRTAGGPVSLVGSQAEIDVTGRVSGVIKRIKVHSPIPIDTNADGPIPEFALQATDTICKRFQVTGPPANQLSFGIFLNSTSGASDDCNPGQTANN